MSIDQKPEERAINVDDLSRSRRADLIPNHRSDVRSLAELVKFSALVPLLAILLTMQSVTR